MARIETPRGFVPLPELAWLGSAPSCSVVVEEEAVPPQAALIVLAPEGLRLLALTRELPLLLNGEDAGEVEPLYDGDEITLGTCLLRLDAPEFPCPHELADGSTVEERRLPPRLEEFWSLMPGLSCARPEGAGRLLKLLAGELPARRLLVAAPDGAPLALEGSEADEVLGAPLRQLEGARPGDLHLRTLRLESQGEGNDGDAPSVRQVLVAPLVRDDGELFLTAERVFSAGDEGGPFDVEDLLILAMAAADGEGRWSSSPRGDGSENLDDTRPLDGLPEKGGRS